MKNWRTELIGSFITRVKEELVFTKADIIDAILVTMEDQSPFTLTISTDMLDPIPRQPKKLSIPRIQWINCVILTLFIPISLISKQGKM